MRIRRGQLDPHFEVWVDAEHVTAAGSMQIILTGTDWERVFLVRTPHVDEIMLTSTSRVPALDFTGLPDPHLNDDHPEPVEYLKDERPDGALGRLLSITLWLVAACALLTGVALATGVLDAQVIQSPSMSPAINPGDLYVGVSSRIRDPQVGDVAAFNIHTLDGASVAVMVHRIIGIASVAPGISGYVTKGDANADAEALPTTPQDLRSTALFTAPFGGIIVSLRPVMIAVLGGLVMLLLLRLRER